MTTKSEKAFDCVEMMHKGALRIHETLKGKSKEEQLAYWQERHAEALKELDDAHQTHPAAK